MSQEGFAVNIPAHKIPGVDKLLQLQDEHKPKN